MPCNTLEKSHFTALAVYLFAAALCTTACGEGASPHDAGPDASTDTDTDADTDTDNGDGGTPYTCTQDEIDAQNAAIQAALAEAVPCFTGGIVPMGATINAYFMAAPDEPSLVLCGDSTPNDLAVAAIQSEAIAALAELELLCLGNSTIVSGGSVVDVAALRAAIDEVTDPAGADAGTDAGTDAVCAVEGLDDPLFVVAVAADGGVAEVQPAEADSTPETAEYVTCLEATLSGMSLPCLATMQICSDYP
jgi:hypothetical protein